MKLYILRHGQAADRGDPRYPNDADRPLTPIGVRRTKALARLLREWDITFDVILSSPLVRARQTAEIVEHALRLRGRLQLSECLAPAGGVGKLVHQLDRLQPKPECILLVGHEPDSSRLISLLCTGGPHLSSTLKKGGLCRMEIESLRAGRCAQLEWLISPRWIGPKRAVSR
jgi:phosphohistidine phosphatase